MFYQKREILNRPLEDDFYFKEYSTGVYLYKYDYNVNSDIFFKKRMYDVIRKEVSSNKYFVLENLCNDGMLLQRITFMDSDNSYNRTACLSEDVNVTGVVPAYTDDVYKFSEWKLDNLNENDIEVKKLLKTASKEAVDERLVSKTSEEYQRLFRYKGRLSIKELLNTTESGFYSVLDEAKEFKKILQVNPEFYNRRINTRNIDRNTDFYNTKNEDKLQGVLEVYKSDKHVLQYLYVSNPFISILNRVLDINSNQWTDWRINQNVDDTYWLQSVNPHSTYVDLPIVKRKLSLNSTSLLYNIRGYNIKDTLQNDVINYAYNKTDSLREPFNTLYTVEGKNPVDFIYGYNSIYNTNVVENNDSTRRDTLVEPKNNHIVDWGTHYEKVNINNITSQENLLQVSTLGTGKLSTFGENTIYDTINKNKVKESFRFINGLSVYWTSDYLYFDILQNIVVDTNTTNENF